ncbi:MAG: helix-turn-helix domain-containing protein [Stappiaceae bacterium]
MLQVTVTTVAESQLCPVRDVLTKVMGKWQSLILLALEDGALRFGVLKRTIGDITQRVLTENLRSLERDGHLVRTVHDTSPIAVTYELTPMGQELLNVLKPLVFWAESSHERVRLARENYDRVS